MGSKLSNKALIGALPLIAQHLGSQYGVKVVFGNYETAMTDGKNIFMPNLPLDDDTTAILANGFIDHESAHILETDFSIRAKTPIEKHLLNIVEDLRIEQALVKRFPGTRKNLNQLVELLVAKGGFFDAPESDNPVNTVLNTALVCGRCDVLGQNALDEAANRAEKHFREQLGDNALTRLRALLNESSNIHSTQQAYDLTRKILKMLEEEQEAQQQQADQEQQQSGDSSDSDSGEDDSQAQQQQGSDDAEDDPSTGESDGDDDAQGDSSTGESEGDSADGEGGDSQQSDATQQGEAQDGDSHQAPQASGDAQDPDASDTSPQPGDGAGGDSSAEQLAEALRRALDASDDDIDVESDMGNAISEELKQDLEENHPHDCVEINDLREMQSVQWQPSGCKPIDPADVSKVTVRLRARLQASLETALRERRTTTDSGRRIHQGRLSRLAVGDPRIFVHKHKKSGLDTAIQILVDRSGSMTGHRINVAMQSALAVMSALEGTVGVATATSLFPQPVTLTGFEEKLAMTRKRYEPIALGGTPLTEALLWSVRHHLSARREHRKMLIVLTDGQPNDPPSAQKVVAQMQRHGIETIGVGIEHMAVREIFPSHTVIDNVDELPNRLFDLIQRKLF